MIACLKFGHIQLPVKYEEGKERFSDNVTVTSHDSTICNGLFKRSHEISIVLYRGNLHSMNNNYVKNEQ